jgi:hypothetical protein
MQPKPHEVGSSKFLSDQHSRKANEECYCTRDALMHGHHNGEADTAAIERSATMVKRGLLVVLNGFITMPIHSNHFSLLFLVY